MDKVLGMKRVSQPLGAAFAFTALALASACGDTEAPAGPATPAVPSPARVVGVEVSGGTTLFQRGQTQQLTARVTNSNGFVEDRSSAASWQSSNSGVVSVSSSGVATAGDEGEATIMATFEGQRGTTTVGVRYGARTPDPPPGGRIPKPNEAAFVASLINSRRDLLARSCQDAGGTWELMDFVVDRLRQEKDLRWGYNGRRGDVNFPARDEIGYHYGSGPDEMSRDTYAFDIIVGHCGPNPGPGWIDQSDLGTLWLSRGRF
jgi:hypothetical protein